MLILALALLGGKLDDPAPPTSKLADALSGLERALSVALREDVGSTPKPSKSTPKVPTPPAALPQLWQLKDRSGRTWTHADPRWLQTYVGRVNAALVPRYTAPVYQFGSPCANGACPR